MPDYSKISSHLENGFAVRNFNDFIPSAKTPFPDFRIKSFMSLGPFVLETDGAFETEYFYEREKILSCDYLASSGGESEQIAYLGGRVQNDYYGPASLCWQKGYEKWGSLRFDDDSSSCNEALYVTQQRNCVFYAACYVRCDEPSEAVILHESSGCKLFVNGEPVDDKPYGRVKGLNTSGHPVYVHFNQGLNLIMFKVRPGYIADGMDMTISNCSIYPLAVSAGDFGITYAQPTALFFGTKEQPLESMQCFCVSRGEIEKAGIKYCVKEYTAKQSFSDMRQGECRLVRLKLPAADSVCRYTTELTVSDGQQSEKVDMFIETVPVSYCDTTDFCFSDFHFDTTYHQEQRTYALGAFHITKCITDKLVDDKDFKAVLSEVDYLHPYYSIYPSHRAALKKAFTLGRAEADCFYNQPNELTSSGEGIVRNLVYGQLYHRDVLGRITSIYAPGDVFGHPNQLTQICSKGGCRAIQWGKFVLGLDWVFRHVSPDGTVGLHNKGIDVHGAQVLGLHHSSGGYDLRPCVRALPCEGKTGWMKKTLNGSHFAVFSEMVDGIAEDVRKADAEGVRKVDIVSRDLTQHHSGVLLTRTDFKQANRLAENLLITAEKFSSIAAYYGAQYPEKALDKAWRQLLCAQHHDSVTGTNNEISFVDLMIEYREAVELASDVVRRACAFIADSIKADTTEPLYAVFNPHSWQRSDACTITVPQEYTSGCELCDSKGGVHKLSIIGDGRATFTASVPALGYESYILRHSNKREAPRSCGNTIENEFYSVSVDANLGGGIVSIYDKLAEKEVVNISKDGPANRVAVLREIAQRMEQQHEIYTTGQKLFSSDFKAEVIGERCEAYERLTITFKMDVIACVKQTITLSKGVKRIDMNTVIEDYQGRDDLFALTFPVNVRNGKVIFDDRFAPHVFSSSQRKLSFQTHQYASFSHSKIAPVNQWLELGRTSRIQFTDGDINIGMCAIIRNPSLYSLTDDFLIALSKRAIPVTPYSDREQYGSGKLVHFNEDLDNTDTRFVLSVSGVSNEYEAKLLSNVSAEKSIEFEKRLERDGCAVLFTRDSDNIYSKSIDVILIKAQTKHILSARLLKMSEALSQSNSFALPDAIEAVSPGSTEDYGVALINKGNIACSVEPDELITMMLFHTADFYGNIGKTTGGEELIPEQKTHSFSYCLYPHSGDYRQASVYKRALEFNDSLIGIKSERSRSAFPSSKSFLETDGGFIVTALKAGKYPMAQMKQDFGQNRGFALRGFEANGDTSTVTVKTGFKLSGVERTDLLEENGTALPCEVHGFAFDATPYTIETFALDACAPERKLAKSVLGAQREIVEPTYVRSWEHDMGSMNMGYLSVAGIIGKDVEKLSDTVYKFSISMANNHPDTAISGVMRLSLPEGFRADSKTIRYSVRPEGVSVHRVTVTKPFASAEGIMRLTYEHDSQSFEDIYEFGYFDPEAVLTIEEKQIVLSVFNSTSQHLSGSVLLATPFETWKADGFNGDCRLRISDTVQKLDIPAGENRKYFFPIEYENDGVFDAFWAVAKLAVNGRIHFAYAHRKGQRHNVWAHELSNTLFGRDKGSIAELLKL